MIAKIWLNEKVIHCGFTLLELVIAMAVSALLAVIAVGGFQSYLKNAQQHEAGQVLLKDAEFMEQHYSRYGQYTKGNVWPDLPYVQAPELGKPLYRIKLLPTHVTLASANAYSLVAIPLCGTVMAGSECICSDQDSNLNYAANWACNNSGGGCPCTN